MIKFESMTLKPGKPQYKKSHRQAGTEQIDKPARTRKLRSDSKESKLNEMLKIGDTLPQLSDDSGRTAEDLFPDWKKLGASIHEATFAAEYLLCNFNSSLAYARSTRETNLKCPGILGSDMLRRPIVQQLIHDYTTAWLRGKAFELEHKVMETLEALAFYDVSQFLNPDGTPAFSSWDDIPAPLRRCIEGIEIKFYGRDANREVVNISLAKRSEALKSIAAYIAILKNGPLAANESNQVNADAELVLSAVFNSGRKVDRRTPAQLRADQARAVEIAQDKLAKKRSEDNQIQFSGLG